MCEFPCNDGEFLYWNGTCKGSCVEPLQQRTTDGKDYCDYQCTTDEFLYFNQSCLDTCDTPYTSRTEYGVVYCDYPCESDQYLFDNGTCVDSCDSPFVTRNDSNYLYCDFPCADEEYLYWDGECREECEYPLVYQKSEYNLCLHPCDDLEQYYNVDEDSDDDNGDDTLDQISEFCSDECIFPHVAKENDLYKTCELAVTKEDQEVIEDETRAMNVTNDISAAGLAGLAVATPADTGIVSGVLVYKMMQYPRYCDIEYPPRLKYFYKNQNREPANLALFSDIPNQWRKDLEGDDEEGNEGGEDRRMLQESFEEYNVSEVYIVNFWNATFFFLISLIFTLITSVIDHFIQKAKKPSEKVKEISNKIAKGFRWNLPIIIIIANLDSIIIYSFYQYMNFRAGRTASAVSILLSVIFLIAAIIIMVASYKLVKKSLQLQKGVLKEEKEEKKKWDEKMRGFQVLYCGGKEKSFWTQGFLFLYLVRVSVSAMFIVFLYSIPLGQIILITILGLTTIIYLLIFKPFKSTLTFVQYLIMETILAIVHFCVIILAYGDNQDSGSEDSRETVGNVIIYANIAFCVLIVLFILIKIASLLMKFAAQNAEEKAKKQSQKVHPEDISEKDTGKNRDGFKQVPDHSIQTHKQHETTFDNLMNRSIEHAPQIMNQSITYNHELNPEQFRVRESSQRLHYDYNSARDLDSIRDGEGKLPSLQRDPDTVAYQRAKEKFQGFTTNRVEQDPNKNTISQPYRIKKAQFKVVNAGDYDESGEPVYESAPRHYKN